jgi:hypothetical protein
MGGSEAGVGSVVLPFSAVMDGARSKHAKQIVYCIVRVDARTIVGSHSDSSTDERVELN